MEIEPAADSGRNSGSNCSGQGTASQMFKILCCLSNILNITKDNRGRNSGRTEAAVAAEGAGAAVCGRGDSGNGIDSQRRQRWGQATVAKAEAA
jgi:hypothetical protein